MYSDSIIGRITRSFGLLGAVLAGQGRPGAGIIRFDFFILCRRRYGEPAEHLAQIDISPYLA